MFASLIDLFDDSARTFLQENLSNVMDAIRAPAFTLLSCYIMLWGLAHVFGLIREPITDAAKRFIKIGFIFGIALSVAEYNSYVVDVITKGPEQFAAVFTDAAPGSQIGTTLDNVFKRTWDLGTDFWERAGITNGNFGLYFIALTLYFIACLISSYSAFLIILSKVAVNIIVAVGPLFIISALFDSTKRFFESWVAVLSNYAILCILAIATSKFILTIFERNLINVDTKTAVGVTPIICAAIVSLLILPQLPMIASSLGGGIAISTLGAFRGALGAGAKVTGLRAASRYASAKTASAAGSAISGVTQGTYNLVKRPFARTNAVSKG